MEKMTMMLRILSIVMIFCIVLVAVVTWLWYRNPYYVIDWWNQRIASECNQQDARSVNGIPSYQDAWHAKNTKVVELHRLIIINHTEILAEVMEMLANGGDIYSGDIYGGDKYMGDIYSGDDDDLHLMQTPWLKEENRWNPIWVRFMGDWADSADSMPTLKRITALFPEVTTLHVSVFYPGSSIVENQGISRSVHRYHYGLKIPEGDVGLKIGSYDVKWQEKEGFIWDDTISHSAWNHTSEPRIVIFADIMRDLSLLNTLGSQMIYGLLQRTAHIAQLKKSIPIH